MHALPHAISEHDFAPRKSFRVSNQMLQLSYLECPSSEGFDCCVILVSLTLALDAGLALFREVNRGFGLTTPSTLPGSFLSLLNELSRHFLLFRWKIGDLRRCNGLLLQSLQSSFFSQQLIVTIFTASTVKHSHRLGGVASCTGSCLFSWRLGHF